ncbi:MAG: hypothetical protein QG604_490 [Candidatus Dependentiae bacterium]|nr:hypothetical protein [Candidatus Dependentiae bacterium]
MLIYVLNTLLLLLISYSPFLATKSLERPKVTVVIVIDQLSEHVLERHRPLLSGGIRTLLREGTYFSHAYHPHAQPETATGHAMISTGAYAHKHGLVANEWLQPDGKDISACDDISGINCKVFSPTDKKGKSAKALLAPTLATSCIKTKNPYSVIALSLKSRAAIPLAGPHGLPIWFDTKGGVFTSSTAFCSQLPPWVTAMNKHLQNTLHQAECTAWKAQFPLDSEKYQYANPDIYGHTGYPFSLITTPQKYLKADGSRYYHFFEQTPAASQDLFRLGLLAMHNHFKYHPDKPLVLFISLSNFDYAGHYYGPYSKEVIDILYAIDHQLEHFMDVVEKEHGIDNCLWALTADHGVTQIPEVLSAEGNPKAQRVDANALFKELNRIIYGAYNIKNLFTKTFPPHFYIDQDKWSMIGEEKQARIIAAVKSYLQSVDGIIHAWHQSDLIDPNFKNRYAKHDRAHWYATQYMPGRSGDFVVQCEPYTQLSLYPKGTCHDSPYDLDVRVPVIFCGKGIKQSSYNRSVSMRHFAPTMAYLLGVKSPAEAPKEHWGNLLMEPMAYKARAAKA